MECSLSVCYPVITVEVWFLSGVFFARAKTKKRKPKIKDQIYKDKEFDPVT